MGTHTNYYWLILSLLRVKDELSLIKNPKHQSLIELLQNKEIISTEDGLEVIPSNKDIAQELNIPATKCNKLLRELRDKLITSFWNNPSEIKEVIHEVFILRYYDEIKYWNKSVKFSDKSFFIRVKLPVTPKIGEIMEFELADQDEFYRGTVHEITHSIKGHTQLIHLFLDVTKNEYYRWMDLKKEYESQERMIKEYV
ncbi:MAG: hypothetical protein JW833_08585 [Prolixibacteraceae bacterium]|nr:hypothetical protein [Prolixibacteraceae bacterium]